MVATEAIRALLFGVASMDAATYAAVLAPVSIVAALAAYLPARRAAGVDPQILLRDV